MRVTAALLLAAAVLPSQDAPRPKILGVAHIAVFAADYEKSRAFYRDFLGFEEPYSLANADGTPSQALADRSVNITGIVGVAEDTDGALMLTTSDATATREAFSALGIAFEEHDPTSGREPTGLSIADIVAGRPA